MPRSNNRGRGGRSDQSAFSSWTDTAKDKPLASAAVAAAAVGAGVFLWNRRNQISEQLSNLSDQISDWTDSMRSGSEGDQFETVGAGAKGSMTSSGSTGATGSTSSRTSRSTGSRPTSARGRTARTSRGMSETGGGNASLGRQTGSGAGSENF